MDCGPAALHCLLRGFGIPSDYDRLRDACQTDVDGSSIDSLEEVANSMGLAAEQVMLPVDLIFNDPRKNLPAIAVFELAHGFNHFVVIWRSHGPWVQVMDPSIGRTWMRRRDVMERFYLHQMRVPAADFRDWARSDDFLQPLSRRLRWLGMEREASERLRQAERAERWCPLAQLDAVTRLAVKLTRARALRRGPQISTFIDQLSQQRAPEDGPAPTSLIPPSFWCARAIPVDDHDGAFDVAEEEVILRGAVLLRVADHAQLPGGDLSGEADHDPTTVSAPAGGDRHRPHGARDDASEEDEAPAEKAPEVEIGPSPLPDFPEPQTGGSVALLFAALTAASAAVALEAVLLRAVFDIGSELTLRVQRLQAIGAFLLFGLALLLVEWRITAKVLGLGRQLEVGLRVVFYRALPFLNDRYFKSRPVSDMAERAHTAHNLRRIPKIVALQLRLTLTIVLTSVALIWLYPQGLFLVLLGSTLIVAGPLFMRPHLTELDSRVRTHNGALSRFYLDALLGLTTVRAHSAQRAIVREHESLLKKWVQAAFSFLRSVLLLDAWQACCGFLFASALVFHFMRHGDKPSDMLLLAYWALTIPVLAEQLSLLMRQYPMVRNMGLRFCEPLNTAARARDLRSEDLAARLPGTEAPEMNHERPGSPPEGDPLPGASGDSQQPGRGKVATKISFRAVAVHGSGVILLENVDLDVSAGEHLAIVGPSGAGKSCLVGLLLGWYEASGGEIRIDDRPLTADELRRLRADTAWVDPSVQLWNRSLLENILYGSRRTDASHGVSQALQYAGIHDTLHRLDDGMQSTLGENGRLLSGGEGQRTRLARALMPEDPGLVILDEALRGLEEDQRQRLLADLRSFWKDSTLLYVTHRLPEAFQFDRVVVVDNGTVVEDGDPHHLKDLHGSRFSELVNSHHCVVDEMWASQNWRSLHIHPPV